MATKPQVQKHEEKELSQEDIAVQQIDTLVHKAQAALDGMKHFTQEEVDFICHEMVMAGIENHMSLAKLAVEETQRGVYEDKAIKNLFATENVWHEIKYDKTVDVIEKDDQRGLVKVAQPIGVIAGITPVTNPTSTVMFKALLSLKTRNPIIFSFHPSAHQCSAKAATIVRDAAVRAGAPADCIQWIEGGSMRHTDLLINHPGVSITLATGGNAMVKAAYSTGKPALGVGAGNCPAYFEKSCDIRLAVNDLIISKSFDNGMICASEQAIICDKEIYEEVKKEFIKNRAYYIPKKDMKKVEAGVINLEKGAVNPAVVGKSAVEIAKMCGIEVPEDTVLLIGECKDVGPDYPLTREKLSPVIAMLKAETEEEAFALCEKMVQFNGRGHSASIHTFEENYDLIERFGIAMDACRILVNSPSSIGGVGDLFNEMVPSLTLGCGSYGHNSISENVTTKHLLNIKTIARRRNNMQWLKLPAKVYFEKNALRYLEKMPNISRAFIVTDPGMVKFGLTNQIYSVLGKRVGDVKIEIFSDVKPDPDTYTVNRGVERMKDFAPDTIIALGGGSAMDAAKMMWLQYEQPETKFEYAKQKFMDIRKRAYKLSDLGEKCQLVCIPTTSGTGSEVTPFAIITDSESGIKYPITDYALTPSVAIIDPQFTYTLPQSMVADTGLDVLTHALEAHVSVLASDYTRGMSMEAIKLVHANLNQSYEKGTHESREAMHNAATVAGMAFANAFLGINHSLAHKIGAAFHIPHGRANAILLPHVIRYNAAMPTKRQVWAKYEYFKADEDYADIARELKLPGKTTEELVESLAQWVIELAKGCGIEMSIRAQGISREDFDAQVDQLAELAYEDQCTTANPKEPLISELKEILERAYEGV